MFRVLGFPLGFRTSLSGEGVGHMPRRCAATHTNNFCQDIVKLQNLAKEQNKQRDFPKSQQRKNESNTAETRLSVHM